VTDVSGLPASIREHYPLLSRQGPGGRPLIYLDSAATALKPRAVIDAVVDALSNHTANVHRSVHTLGDEATELYESARAKVARLINAESHEVVFVRNTTEALNLVARSWPRRGRVVTTLAEHHSNLLPWGDDVIRLRPTAEGGLDVAALERTLSAGGVSIVSVSHLSNVTGLAIDAAEIAKLVHRAGAILVLDAAQSVPHRPVDVQRIGCDFLAFSGHKLGSPSGIGVLYGRAERLSEIDWHLKGGSTVDRVDQGGTSVVLKPLPWRLEAGTPAIEAAVGLGAAIDFLEDVGLDRIAAHEKGLVRLALRRIEEKLPGIRVLGPRDDRREGPISLVLTGLSPHTIARSLSDGYGICVRSGFHCSQPLHESLGSAGTLRVSFALYNTEEEVEAFVTAVSELAGLHGLGALARH
jgi:cysteine desulfurase / selenocysteine lyase